MSQVLKDLIESEKEARDFGFDWPNQQMIIDWIVGECAEVRAAIESQESAARIQEEIGDVIHAAISLCAFSGFDVEKTMEKAHLKFSKRLKHLKTVSQTKGLASLKGQSMEFMLRLWDEAKKATS